MFLDAALAFADISCKQDHDPMKLRTRKVTDPVIRVIPARVTENLVASGHSLAELFRKASERRFINSERSQPIPRERHGHPSAIHGSADGRRLASSDLIDDASEPGTTVLCPAKG